MRTAIVLSLLVVCLSFGCAGVQVGGTKEPIKVDVTMRLDIYQHIEKDIDAIESIVSGSSKDGPADKQSLLDFCCRNAYAEGAGLCNNVVILEIARFTGSRSSFFSRCFGVIKQMH